MNSFQTWFLLTGSWVQEFERHIGNEFSSKSSTVQLDTYRIRNHNTNGVGGRLSFSNQCRASQVDVVFLQMSIESNSYKQTPINNVQ